MSHAGVHHRVVDAEEAGHPGLHEGSSSAPRGREGVHDAVVVGLANTQRTGHPLPGQLALEHLALLDAAPRKRQGRILQRPEAEGLAVSPDREIGSDPDASELLAGR